MRTIHRPDAPLFPAALSSGVRLLLLLIVGTASLAADTRGKLAGRVVDERTNEPLIGINIVLVGTSTGAATDFEGNYVILNIPPASYEVRFSGVGYAAKVIREVRVSAGQTTTLNLSMAEEVVKGQEVVIIATRPIVDTRQTSAVSIMDSKEIDAMPVQELSDIVNLQAGVVDGHFRGGRIGEVQYQVDGVSINNPYDNSASIRIDKSIIQEVQVVSGTFDAEYGQAMSGVVNAILKSGSGERYDYAAEAYIGQYVGDAGRYPYIDRFRPFTTQSYQFSLSGPTPLPNTTFLVSGRRLMDDGYLYGERRFSPFDTMGTDAALTKHPTGDNEIVPMNYFNEWSGQAKVSTRLSAEMQLSYQLVFNQSDQKNYSYSWRFNPEGLTVPKRSSFVHGLDWTHNLSPTLFYTVSARQNSFDYKDYMYEDVFDPRYDQARDPRSDANYFDGAVVQGVSFTRFIQRTNSYVAKSSVTWQADNVHLLKAGIEGQLATIEFGAPGSLTMVADKVQRITLDTLNAAVVTSRPRWLSGYVQDKMEFTNIVLRGGVRVEAFDANTTVPGDLANPVNAIPGAPTAAPKAATMKVSVAPRLGISYPITDRSSVFFSYGHFYQYPALGNLFSNANYNVLRYLQEGGISYGVMGNPDLEPERTIQYEFGYKGAVTDMFGVDVSVFYKDIRDLLGVEFISTYTAAEYARFTNVDFGGVTGSTIALDYRAGTFSASMDYTFQVALGNSSDPRETANRAAAGEDPRPRVVPLGWDQRHTMNVILGLSEPDDYGVSLIMRLQSGQPYTPELTPGFNGEIETNSGAKPGSFVTDLRVEKFLTLGGLRFSVFTRVSNLFGTHYSNGFVFANTGSVDYSLNPYVSRTTLADPSRYYAPRKIEAGISLNGMFE
ncbi:MAG: TonB-dependent receptor [Bacteroidetes bacterium]|nr:MAG: TonB-dependent receptor [Bacteroidota bacterium]